MKLSKLTDTARIQRLQPPHGKVRMVLDTDTFNEIDDQFALVYALLSPEQLAVEAIYAAPFFNHRSGSPGDGMEKSYDEIQRLLDRLDVQANNLAHRGSDGFLSDYQSPFSSSATNDLIERAMSAADPLYVVAIGALTNIASAILLEPRIIEKIIVVWLGGHALHWPHTVEFNLVGDVLAARLIFDCGVPLTLIPCLGVTSHLRTTVPEIERYVQGQGAIGDYLAGLFKAYHDDHFAWSKEIWDMAPIAYLINTDWISSHIVASPIIAQSAAFNNTARIPYSWSFDPARHPIRCAGYVHRDPIFRDLFVKLADWAAGKLAMSY